ncbi:polysaccharide deacetylase family protein [Dactylosporangium sp. NPDC051541]|uniref:polysaccharide deacetylase family protein n=1 Tax=Dactylosporangium sp. NPDC051541 TaxID=3363977 RepID=UPI0037886E45
MLWRRAAVLGLAILVLTLGGSGVASPPRTTAVVSVPLTAVRQETPATSPATSSGPSASPSASAPAPVVTTGTGPAGSLRTTGSDAVALTFDDGPWDDTPAVLDLLAQYHVKATFCMVGHQVAAHAALVRRMVAEGHTLCNHTWSHDEQLPSRAADRMRSELQRTNDAIHAVVPGAAIPYYRAPGGNFAPNVVTMAAGMGMTSIYWTVDPQDWRGPGVQSIIHNVLTHTHPGSIVLLHDGAGPQTVTALRTILPDLAGRFTLIALPVPDSHGTA